MSTPRTRLFEGVESSLWKLAEPPSEPVTKEQIKPTMTVNQAIYTLLAEAHPKALTVFEVSVDLRTYWRQVPMGLYDEHSTVHQYLERGKPRFVEVSPRPPKS